MLAPYKEFWDGQKRLLHCEPDVTLDVAVYQGGVGSGKTWIGSLLGLLLCKKYPGILGLVLAKTYPMVRDTTLRTYFEHFDAFGFVKGRDYRYNKSDGLITFPRWGNSELLFRHLQDPEKIKSINAGFIEVEEASQLTEADFDMCLSRLRQKNVQRRRFFGHTNPHAAKGWIYERFVEMNQGKLEVYNEYTEEVEVVQYRRIIAPSTDNKALPAIYVENLRKQLDPQMFRIFVLGQDGDYTAGLVSHSFSDLNVVETEYKPDLAIHLTCDFNVDPMSWALAHRYNGEYHFFDEIVVENTHIDACIDEFVRRYPAHSAGVTINGDASGNNRSVTAKNEAVTVNNKRGTAYTEMLNRFTFHKYPGRVRVDVREGNPPIINRVNAWNGMVCNTEGVRRVFIHPRCKWLLHNLRNLKYKDGTGIIEEPTAEDIKKDRKLKFVKHIFDAASYLIEKYDPIILKTPKKGHDGVIVHKALQSRFSQR